MIDTIIYRYIMINDNTVVETINTDENMDANNSTEVPSVRSKSQTSSHSSIPRHSSSLKTITPIKMLESRETITETSKSAAPTEIHGSNEYISDMVGGTVSINDCITRINRLEDIYDDQMIQLHNTIDNIEARERIYLLLLFITTVIMVIMIKVDNNAIVHMICLFVLGAIYIYAGVYIGNLDDNSGKSCISDFIAMTGIKWFMAHCMCR